MNRLSLTLAALALTALSLPATVKAQASATTTIAPPMLPLVTSYRYWPVQFVQWVGPELPYSMIELDVDPKGEGAGKHPLLYVTLTERATGKRIHYTDNPDLLAAAAAFGEEAHKTALAFDAADNDATGSISTLRFALADGKPLEWRFVQGSDISEQGSGLSPLPESKIPVFAYREQAVVAGEGTALKIGDTVSAASVWSEISQPPYFVAYRGAESQSAHMLVFLPAKESWTVTSSPVSLIVGSSWELDSSNGNHLSLRIAKADALHLSVLATNRFEPGMQRTLEVTRNGDGWRIDRVRFSPVREGEKHALTLQFNTPPSAAADTAQITLTLNKKTIASGSLAATGAAADRIETLAFSNPAWLSGKTIVTEEAASSKEIVISAHP